MPTHHKKLKINKIISLREFLHWIEKLETKKNNYQYLDLRLGDSGGVSKSSDDLRVEDRLVLPVTAPPSPAAGIPSYWAQFLF